MLAASSSAHATRWPSPPLRAGVDTESRLGTSRLLVTAAVSSGACASRAWCVRLSRPKERVRAESRAAIDDTGAGAG